VTRGLVELTRFGMALGAKADTFQGLAGVGDVITTCFSLHGRNRRLGERLGRGESLNDIVASTNAVVEGVTTAKSVFERSKAMGLELPIATGVYRILYENQAPTVAFAELMSRRSGSERLSAP
jgi:glycerol-3-phosphate dehydrogenase (NAD(P)+)